MSEEIGVPQSRRPREGRKIEKAELEIARLPALFQRMKVDLGTCHEDDVDHFEGYNRALLYAETIVRLAAKRSLFRWRDPESEKPAKDVDHLVLVRTSIYETLFPTIDTFDGTAWRSFDVVRYMPIPDFKGEL